VQLANNTTNPFFPGVGLSLAGTQAGCTTAEPFIIREVHYTLQTLAIFLADRDSGGGIVPQFTGAGATTCSNTVIGQVPYSITGLN
jgi:hypothetical protein